MSATTVLSRTLVESTCIACDQARPVAPATICAGCTGRMVKALTVIADGYHRLELTPATRGYSADGGGSAGGFGSKPPLRVDVLSLTYSPVATGSKVPNGGTNDPASPGRDASDSPPSAREGSFVSPWSPVVEQLREVSDRLRAELPVPFASGVRRSVGDEVALLRRMVPAIARRWWADEALEQLERTARVIRRALGEDERTIPLGACVRERATGGLDELCGGQVRARVDAWFARCHGCGHVWRGEGTLRALAAAVGPAYLDLPALRTYLEPFRIGAEAPSPALLRQWARRHGWAREQVGGRTRYRVVDALASARAAWEHAHPVQGPELPPGWLAEVALEGPVTALRPTRRHPRPRVA